MAPFRRPLMSGRPPPTSAAFLFASNSMLFQLVVILDHSDSMSSISWRSSELVGSFSTPMKAKGSVEWEILGGGSEEE